MALTRCSSVSRRNSGNEPEKEENEPENKSGYIQILVRPLEQGSGGYFLKWLLRCVLNNKESVVSPQHMGVCYYYYSAGAAVACAVLILALYQILMCDVGILFQRVCSLLIPLFSIMSAFYWLTVCLRQSWSNSSIYVFFGSCFLGELFAYIFLRDLGFATEDPNPSPSHTVVNIDNHESIRVLSMPNKDSSQVGDYFSTSSAVLNSNFTTQPLVVVCVLLFISTASVFSSLETTSSACVILLVSFTRFLACSSLLDMPFGLRPFLAYSCGFAGVMAAKYMEGLLKPQVKSLTTQDGKIPVIKRRKSSSSGAQIFCAQRSNRRTSLPALIQKSQSSSGFESALIGEAHGLITDMLADSNLPLHIVSGLRAVGNLLKPTEAHGPFHKPRVSPLVSLTENPIYGSDNEESPFTGERPSTLPKRLRRSLPPSLIRRMSTSTWTTTTTATGMPTLEPEPCRQRTSSLRHSCDTITPGSSPSDSRSSSPSPLSNSSTILAIPKSRSLSLASVTTAQSPYQRRLSKRSVCSESALDFNLPPLASEESKDAEDLLLARHNKNVSSSLLIQKRDVTSDYDSSDSPSSSDHSDHVSTSQHTPEALTIKDLQKMSRGSLSKARNRGKHFFQETGDKEQEDNDYEEDDDDDDEENQSSAKDKKRSASKQSQSPTKCPPISKNDNGESNLLFNPEKEVEKSPLLQISRLNEWDFPIFELAQSEGSLLLTKVAYKVFSEVGLMEMFRIPLLEFLNYFHDLECGYRNKPYHNCIHATDVLHGVYFMTTQPIPGFVQVNPTDVLSRPGYLSESDSDMPQRCFKIHQPSFMTEDSYGIMGSNFPALELLALYTASAMHDYDHPGRTNAFLVATSAPQAVLYNDRSVLENHHAASSWSLLLQNSKNFFISTLDAAEFKRFRFLVIEYILATDLKRHFEILAEFNAKVNDDEAPGIDWTQETDRLLVSQMVIKLADINGPAKDRDLHQQWTVRIAEEFYEQGDEEASLGLPISPYMDRRNPQLAKLQETFINHLVAPLCNAMVTGGLVPGTWAQESQEEVAEREILQSCDCKDTEDDTDNDTDNELENMCETIKVPPRKVNCLLTKHLKENYDYWIGVMKAEEEELKKGNKGAEISSEDLICEKTEMEPIKEESESPPLSAHGLSSTSLNSLIPSDAQNNSFEAGVWTPVFEEDMSTAV